MKNHLSKKQNNFVILLLIIGLLSATISGFAYLFCQTKDKSDIVRSYCAMIKNSKFEDADLRRDKYGLARLIVCDYAGESYGAVAVAAYNQTAILQYDSPKKAKAAAKLFLNDSIIAEPDSKAEIETEKGELCQWASDTVGTKLYINKCNMSVSNVTVAQIDTGINTSHSETEGRFVSNGFDLTSDSNSDAGYDKQLRGSFWHATAVASVICNNTPDSVKILPYKVIPFGKETCDASAIIVAMRDAIDRGVDVMNLSLSTAENAESFKSLVNEATAKGISVCCSAGNDSAEIKYRYPSAVDSAIAVSSVNEAGEISSFSNYGSKVDFAAPGEKIKVAAIDSSGNNAYKTASGTSLSSPYVAACCALLKGINKDLSVNDIEELLKNNATDLGDSGFDEFYGNGEVNIANINYSSALTSTSNYEMKIPEGTLSITGSGDLPDFPDDTSCPWNEFSQNIVSVFVDNSITSVGNHTFENFKNATFELPKNLQNVGAFAFKNCGKFENITFDKSIKSIGTAAFYGCTNLTVFGWQNTPAETAANAAGVNFSTLGCVHNYVCKIVEPTDSCEGYMLYTCAVCNDSYKEPFVSPQVIGSGTCGNGVQWNCYDTGQLVISGNGDMNDYSTESSPWQNIAEKITAVFIENQVNYVSAYAFASCSNVTAFSATDCNYTSKGGILYSKDGSELVCYPNGLTLSSYTLPKEISKIQDGALSFAKNLNVVDSASNSFVVSDDGLLLNEEQNKIILALPQFVLQRLVVDDYSIIGSNAFLNVNCLTQLVLTKDVVLEEHSVGYGFLNGYYQNNLSVFAPENSSAENYCSGNIKYFQVNSGSCGANANWYFDLQCNVLYVNGEGDMTSYSSFASVPWSVFASRITSTIVSEQITLLSPYSFYNAPSLSSITLPANLAVTTDSTVFAGCSNVKDICFTAGNGIIASNSNNSASIMSVSKDSLQQITIGDGITAIGESAFYQCSKLTSVALPNSVTTVGSRAFHSCRSLISVTIGNNVQSMGYYTFYNDNALKSFYITATDLEFTEGMFYGVPSDFCISAYYDTTAMKFAQDNSYSFSGIGCLHRVYRDEGEGATCTTGATVHRFCARCAEDLGLVYINPKGHSYVETVITSPTCTDKGYSKYACSVCNESYEAETNPLGHDYETIEYTAPTCCESGTATYHCKRCDIKSVEVINPLNTVHYVKGTIVSTSSVPINGVDVYCDNVLVAKTNENGVFMFDGIKCKNHNLSFVKGNYVTSSANVTVNSNNVTSTQNVYMLYGDINHDEYVNVRDFALAYKQGISLSADATKSITNKKGTFSFETDYGVQGQIGCKYMVNRAYEQSDYQRSFEANVNTFNEYTVTDCGFIYGKNMADDMLLLENVGKSNDNGFVVKINKTTLTSGRKILLYGSSSKSGKISARYYIKYTNGVFEKTYYSEVSTYTYE